jgi:hypothetical protein
MLVGGNNVVEHIGDFAVDAGPNYRQPDGKVAITDFL